jgi:hypothetical protein
MRIGSGIDSKPEIELRFQVLNQVASIFLLFGNLDEWRPNSREL